MSFRIGWVLLGLDTRFRWSDGMPRSALTGLYRFMRHPAYSGMSALTLATPLILSSRWAFVPAVVTAVVTALRRLLEDRTFRNELEGYADYARW